ncbi:MAG: lysyl-tRNA synthetase, class [Candidatus Parcubacteria bacterium]|jgi:lysyl-tRNA synthetase class 2|nr:lysyl-tRNA synthetase, class [Candidatus Parcubacteria bacterium]
MSTLENIRQERIAKLQRLRDNGMDPYPARTERTHTITDFLEAYGELEKAQTSVTIAGRIMSIRDQGGVLFADLMDGTGKAQLVIQADTLGEEKLELFRSLVDGGDIIEAAGTAYTTKRGMQSLSVSGWRMLAKSLQPVPDQWYGIKDEDERYRKRYLDILLSPEIADRIRRRSLFWNTIRSYLLEQDFVEVETPALETTTGGADARPFVTHHHALDIDVYLRISAGELWQKRLMVAGLPKVFEIGRIFRNEGMSFEHLQDYTQLEYYQAFSDYEKGMEMITDLYRTIADKVYGTRIFTIKDFTVDLGKDWVIYDYCTLIQKEFGIDPLKKDTAEVAKALTSRAIPFDEEGFSIERGVDLLWKQLRKTLTGPGFLVRVPAYLEPLAKRSADDERVVERFQVLIAGSEMGKGFSELNDPVDQAGRFQHQQALRDGGDEEAQMNDASYVEALEYGMPPAFGFGLSERFFSFLEGVSAREAQIFPLMRPKTEDAKEPKTKERQVAVAVVRKEGLEPWQVLNTVAHLAAELGIREGRTLLTQDALTTADDERIPLNMRHAIILKETGDVAELRNLLRGAQANGLQAGAFTREMIETTNDRKIIETTAKMTFDEVDLLGVLVFGPASAVEPMTESFNRYA